MIICLIFSVSSINAAEINNTNQDLSTPMHDVLTINAEDSNTTTLSSGGDGVSNAENNNLGSTDDSNDELLSDETIKSFDDLANEINSGKNSNITLNGNYYKYGNTTYNKNFIAISNSSIDGNGAIIDGNDYSRAFGLNNQHNLTLKNINFKNLIGYSLSHATSGSCFNVVSCSNILIENCTFNNTRNTGTIGGAILLTSCINVTIKNCNFTSIHNGHSGGVIDFYVANSNFYNIIENCNFYDCTIPKGYNGGAIEFYTANSTIKNCTFINCAGGTGGAVRLTSGSPDDKILNCIFINCTASTYGGALRINSGDNILISNCQFENCSAETGGAISSESTNSTIANCSFTNNYCTGNGGAVVFYGTNGLIMYSNFTNNDASTYGGAVYANAKDSHVDSCRFENNTATDGSNFYATAGNSIEITNCGFDLFYVSEDGTGDGLRSGAPTSFENAVQSIEDGGKIYLIGTFTSLYNKRVEKPVILEGYDSNVVVNLQDANNRAITITASEVTVKKITFKNSLITGDGGVLYWSGANGNVIECTFDNNTARNGGAIYWSGVNGTICSSTFTSNTATANGGAVYWAGDNGAIESSIFTNNNAIYGSAVFLKNGVSTFELKDSQFTSNTASSSGTVAAEKLTTFSLGGNTFISNTVGSGDTDYYFYDNAPVITSSLVYVSPSGSATSNGLTESTPTTLDHAIDDIIEDGGQIVFLAGNYNFERTINNMNLTFVGRTGAIITGSRTSRVFTITGSSNIVFDGLTFSALSFGSTSVDSVISASSSNVDIKNSEFKTITGSNLASVITYDVSSSGNIVDSTFTSNTATNLVNINGNVNVTGSSFTSNSGRTSSVSYNSGSKGTISGTTFSSNSGTYRNLYVNSNNVVVIGNTFDTTASLNTVSTVIYPNNVALSGTFNTGSNYAFSGISAKNGSTVIATGSVSSNTYSATWTKPLPGTYTVTLANTDNKGNTFNYASTPSVSVPVRLTTVYIGPSATGAKTGIDTNNLATWADVAGILTTDGTVVFTAGTYSNFYGKTVSNSWKLTGSGSVILDANNNGRIFTISANNVQISGLTFKNGKAIDSYGSAIHWTGTGGSITNSVLTANTGRPITATNTVSISNSQLKDQISLTKSNINWGSTENITGTFAHSAPTTVNILFNGASQGSYTVTSNTVTADYDYKNTASRSVGSYVVTDQKNNHEEVL